MHLTNGLAVKIERYKKFYNGFEPGKLLLKTVFPMEGEKELDFAVQSLSFTSVNLFSWEETKTYFNRVIDWLAGYSAYRSDIDDDWIPELFVHLGTGVCGACFDDTNVQFSPDTSWVSPSLPDWSEMSRLDPDKNTFWAKRLQDITEYIQEQNRDRFAVLPNIHFTPLDAANVLRGNLIFTDFFDEPGKVEQLLDYCTQVTLRMQRKMISITGDVDGGQVIWNMWMPGKSAIGLQEDICNLCSPEIYGQYSRPYTQRLISECGGGFIHTHMLGKHQFSLISSIRGLAMMNIANDPNCPRALEVLDGILDPPNKNVPLNILCTPGEIKPNLANLRKIHAVLWVQCKNKDEAARSLKLVREISLIK